MFCFQEKLRTPHEFQHGDAVMEAIVKDRCGSVLGKGSILKIYFFPGQRTSSYIRINGAPHVFKVSRNVTYCQNRASTFLFSISLVRSTHTVGMLLQVLSGPW